MGIIEEDEDVQQREVAEEEAVLVVVEVHHRLYHFQEILEEVVSKNLSHRD